MAARVGASSDRSTDVDRRTDVWPRTVLVANQKGGVGKSSIVAGLAGLIARPAGRVLVVDADQQGNVSRNNLGVDGDRGRSLAMALQYAEPLQPVREVRLGLDVVPGGPLLAGMPAVLAAAPQTGIDPAANLLTTLGQLCESEGYVLALVDSGPGDSQLLDVLLASARYLLVPSTDDEASLDGVELLAARYLRARAAGAPVELLGAVLFNVNVRAYARNALALASLSQLLAGSGAEPFPRPVRTDRAAALDARRLHLTPAELVEQARAHNARRIEGLAAGTRPPTGEPFWSRDGAGLANDYQQLAREVLARISRSEDRHGRCEVAS
ncbi:MAG: putative ATPase involved in chromosome partitioning [Gemmatimonadales bacterium]|nr:putative ATPase involved in chromosome partitioning [Gemmatimonadales bacterium]